MADYISDVNVVISVEDVINPAVFGGMCLFSVSDDDETAIPYTEIYSMDEAEKKITTGEHLSEDKVKALKNAARLAFMQENPPEKVGVLSCSVENLSKYIGCEWRYLIPIGADSTNIEKLAKYIESCEGFKVLGVYMNTEDFKSAEATLIDKIKSYERTFVYVGVKAVEDTIDENQIVAALIGKTSGKAVGSFTYKNQALKGVYADEAITKSELEGYHGKNVNAYVHKAGYDVTSEGVLINGEYIDILDSKDWLITQIKYQLQQALIVNDKIPYDNQGISLLESIVVNVLQDAYNNGMIAEAENGTPLYTVNFAPRSATKASDREKRQYVEGRFSFDLAGAVHTVTVNGVINI